jgi:hypothetical protein
MPWCNYYEHTLALGMNEWLIHPSMMYARGWSASSLLLVGIWSMCRAYRGSSSAAGRRISKRESNRSS